MSLKNRLMNLSLQRHREELSVDYNINAYVGFHNSSCIRIILVVGYQSAQKIYTRTTAAAG